MAAQPSPQDRSHRDGALQRLGRRIRRRLGRLKNRIFAPDLPGGPDQGVVETGPTGAVVHETPARPKLPRVPHHTPLDQMVHRFVISAGRAGSTFIAIALNMHPKVCCQIESHHLPLLIDAFGDEPASPRALLAVTMQAKFHTGAVIVEHSLDRLDIDRSAFFDWQQRLIADHDRMSIHAFQTALADFFLTETGKSIFVDKTPCYGWRMADLRHALPRTRFVNLVRDCVPSVRSMLQHEGFIAKMRAGETNWTDILQRHDFRTIDVKTPVGTPQDIRDMGLLWARRTAVANARADLPPVSDLRYEDLLSSPDAFLRMLCDGIDIPFDAAWAQEVIAMIAPSQTSDSVSPDDAFAAILDIPEIRQVRSRLGYV